LSHASHLLSSSLVPLVSHISSLLSLISCPFLLSSLGSHLSSLLSLISCPFSLVPFFAHLLNLIFHPSCLSSLVPHLLSLISCPSSLVPLVSKPHSPSSLRLFCLTSLISCLHA
jgi:hypothetical protein